MALSVVTDIDGEMTGAGVEFVVLVADTGTR